MGTPFIGFNNDTLDSRPRIRAGDWVRCISCLEEHEVKESDPPGLEWIHCDESGKAYIVAIDGRSIAGLRPDRSGSI